MLANLRDALAQAHEAKPKDEPPVQPPKHTVPPDLGAALKRAIEALQDLAKAIEQ